MNMREGSWRRVLKGEGKVWKQDVRTSPIKPEHTRQGNTEEAETTQSCRSLYGKNEVLLTWSRDVKNKDL